MQTSLHGAAFIAAHEGVVPAPYYDVVGVLTYGVGHTKAAGAPDPADLAFGMPRDLDAALRDVFALFRRDLAKYEAEVSAAITAPMAQHEFDAAVSFHFNTGAIARADWVKAFNAGDRGGAGDKIMNWSKPASIIPRREAEQDLFRHGLYGVSGVVVWGVTGNGRVIWSPERLLSRSELVAMLSPITAPDPTEGAPAGLSGILAAVAAFFASLGDRK